MTYIRAITTAVPANKTTMNDLLEWSDTAYSDSRTLRKFKFIVQRSGIHSRFSVLPDFQKGGGDFFGTNTDASEELPATSTRLKLFKTAAIEIGTKAAVECLENASLKPGDITHIIAVSCTGIMAPGLEILWSKTLGLPQETQRLTVNFMGCYAAFHALRLAKLICSEQAAARVLIIAAEFCTLHFRNTNREADLLSTAIFADGCAALILEGESSGKTQVKWLGGISRLADAPDDMSWNILEDGFEMQLTGNVPVIIEEHILSVFLELLRKHQVNREDIDYFAIHPGGKNVLHAFEKAIGIDSEILRESYHVLSNYGNMSSPTVLFVLKEVMENFEASEKKSALVFSAAFGPGLTIEAALITFNK